MTLQSILKEDNDTVDDEFLKPMGATATDTRELKDDKENGRARSESVSTMRSRAGSAMSISSVGPPEIFKPTVLKKVTAQLNSPGMKKDLGLPTAIAVELLPYLFFFSRLLHDHDHLFSPQITNMIYVGTSRGLIAIFDFHQNLKQILGSAPTGTVYLAI